MKDILYRHGRICRDLAEITEKINRSVAEYSASFSCDLFGQCKLPAQKVEKDLGTFVETLMGYSSMIEDRTGELITLIGEVEDYIGECLENNNKDNINKAEKLLSNLRQSANLCMETFENCFGEFLGRLHGILELSGETVTVNVGLIRNEVSNFTVRLKSYVERITRLDG